VPRPVWLEYSIGGFKEGAREREREREREPVNTLARFFPKRKEREAFSDNGNTRHLPSMLKKLRVKKSIFRLSEFWALEVLAILLRHCLSTILSLINRMPVYIYTPNYIILIAINRKSSDEFKVKYIT
jgi:hypothetical protein